MTSERIAVESENELANAIRRASRSSAPITIYLRADIYLTVALPSIEADMRIIGNGHWINGDGKFQIFNIRGLVQIDSLNMSGGRPSHRSEEWGGAILVNESSSLSASNCVFKNNFAGEYALGGAIFNNGKTVVSGCTFHSNEADIGGAILNNSDPMVLRNCLFSANRSHDKGGAVYNVGDLTIVSCTFLENSAVGHGGALFTEVGTVEVFNCTLIGNSSGENGGAICHAPLDWADITCSTTLTHVTIAHNESKHRGGGVFVEQGVKTTKKMDKKVKQRPHSIVRLRNSIIAGNRGGDCVGWLDQNVSNLIEDGSCDAELRGNPMLGKLVEPRDGSPAYCPLLPGSPAIGAGFEGYCLPIDQRGKARNQGVACDIGAYKYVSE